MLLPELLFYSILGIIIINYVFDLSLSILNARFFKSKLPVELNDIFTPEEYQKSQAYKKESFEFSVWISTLNIIVIISLLVLNAFAFLHYHLAALFQYEIYTSLTFFGILFLGNFLLNLPLSWYQTFVIEQKYGFNTTTTATFWLDQLKSILLTFIIGGLLLALVYFLFSWAGTQFWWYTWIVMSVLIVLINMFYTKLILPLFNKLTPLKDGDLRDSIETYARSVNFNLSNIFIIDGSKRSTKANAFFSGFGSQKQVTLYDTLVNDLNEDEVVAVLAHEVGHYKHKHIIYNLIISILSLGLSLFLLSLFLGYPAFSQALGVQEPSFHIGLIAFGFIYTPISFLIGIMTNVISRRFEYQADNYAKASFNAQSLMSGLKKLTKNSLSNLTPHPSYVFFNFSHPTLLQRFRNLNDNV